jgi:TRAP-type uncharacterized transport system fused permease subunit
MPAFVVPFMFVLTPDGIGLLLKMPPDGHWLQVVWMAFTACVGIAGIAAGMQGWIMRRCRLIERVLLIGGGLALAFPNLRADAVGAVLVATGVALHFYYSDKPATTG